MTTFGYRSYQVASAHAVFEPAEHCLQADVPRVSPFVIFDGRLAVLPAWEADAQPIILKSASEPRSAIATFH